MPELKTGVVHYRRWCLVLRALGPFLEQEPMLRTLPFRVDGTSATQVVLSCLRALLEGVFPTEPPAAALSHSTGHLTAENQGGDSQQDCP